MPRAGRAGEMNRVCKVKRPDAGTGCAINACMRVLAANACMQPMHTCMHWLANARTHAFEAHPCASLSVQLTCAPRTCIDASGAAQLEMHAK